MRGLAAAIRPEEDELGTLRQFEGVMEEKSELLVRSQPFGGILKEGASRAPLAWSELEFNTGQDICLTVGRSVRDLKNAGTLLAWMLCHCMRVDCRGAWRWLCSVIFEKRLTAAGCEGPKRAASFPMRVGDLRNLLEALSCSSLVEVAGEEFSTRWAEDAWVFLALNATSCLAGHVRPLSAGAWSALERRGAETARTFVRRVLTCTCGTLPPFEKTAEELRAARVDYCGEETGVCEPLTLDQITPALPPCGHGGSIKLVDLVSDATREILEHPEDLLLPSFPIPRPKVPGTTHFGKGEKLGVCEALVERGICEWVESSCIVEIEGTRVLNGLFGVKKPACLEDGRPTLRVIMNLKATNSVMTQIRGAVEGLPAITAWQAALLEGQEGFHFYQSDISSAFYLFELPRAWLPFLGFNVECLGEHINKEKGIKYTLACRVLPMGMHSSVSLMQEVSETILWREGLQRQGQIRRGQPVPAALIQAARQSLAEDRCFWQVYLDNFMGGEKRACGSNSHGGDQVHEVCEQTWKKHGILSSEKKRVSNSQETEELGALLQGKVGMIGASPQRFCKLIQATLWVIAQKPVTKKMVQVLAGRWIHILQFRRPGMSFLDKVWSFINKIDDQEKLSLLMKREFFLIMGAIPLLHTFFGAEVSDTIWCSDASERGGAVGFSRELSSQGKDFVMSSQISGKTLGTAPILVVGLFSGIGGTFRIYDLLDILPQGMVAVDIHAPANRIVSRRWPAAQILRDVRAISRDIVSGWAKDFHTIEEVHLWGGFPCRDLSSARAYRRNLEGDESSLFFEFLRIWQLLVECFPSRVTVKVAAENVASMDETAAQEISGYMGLEPYYLDPVEAAPLRRPRLCWTSEDIAGSLDGVQVVPDRRWKKVIAVAPYPHVEQWISGGFSWPGEEVARAFPTCMRAVWKDKPPVLPAGIHRADGDCRARWALSGYIYPPYQFRSEFLLWRGTSGV